MIKLQQYVFLGTALAVVSCSGCARWKKAVAADDEVSPLAPLAGARDGVSLEVFFVTLPEVERDQLDNIWKDADEQKYATELRRRLAQHGFRVGTVASPAPAVLESLLRRKSSGADGTIAKLDADPTVSRKSMSLRFDSPGQILASDIQPRVPLLTFKDGKLRGRDYDQAQGLFAVRATEGDGGRVVIELEPELHHGTAGQQWTGRDGRFVLESNRPKEVFAELATRSGLSPGQILLVGGNKSRPGSLGDLFFTRDVAGQRHVRLLAVRVKSAGE